ncbi:MAG TPA: oligosaccharide flippase family protein [Candidatus Ozemobacteraceae bacterium]|nr:oligosaccharide flippase family protein [Candidatus Ozemobacteraceae bacterium]
MRGKLGLYWMLPARILGWLGGFGAILLAARLLGTGLFGAFSIALAVWGLVIEAVTLGYPRLLIRELPGHAVPSRLIGTVLSLEAGVATAASLGLAVAVAWHGDPWLSTGLAWLIPAALALPLLTVPSPVAQADQNWSASMLLDIGMPLLWCLFMLAVWAGLAPVSYVWAPLTAAVILWAVIGGAWALHRTGCARPQLDLARILGRESLLIGVSILLGSLYNKFDLFLLRGAIPAESHGLYAAAVMLYMNGVGFSGVWVTALYPVLTAHARDEVHRRGWIETRHTFGLLAALAVGYCVAQGDWFGRLIMGSAFSGMGSLLTAFFCLLPLQVGNMFLDSLLVARRKSASLPLISATGLGISIVGGLLLIPRWGVTAALGLRFAIEALVGGLKLWVIRDMAVAAVGPMSAVREVAGWVATGLAVAAGSGLLAPVSSWLGLAWAALVAMVILRHLMRRYAGFVAAAATSS